MESVRVVLPGAGTVHGGHDRPDSPQGEAEADGGGVEDQAGDGDPESLDNIH